MAPVSAQYSIILRVEIDHRPGMLGRVATAIGDAGGSIGSVDLVDADALTDLRVLIVGLGAAGIAVAKILLSAGVTHVIGCDSKGALHTTRADYLDGSMPGMKRWFAEATNPDRRAGAPADVIDGADLFIGLSGARVMPPAALARMNRDAMVFAMANPTPEVTPEEAAPYARVIATGRSDYPNQIVSSVFNRDVAHAVAVADQAKREGAAVATGSEIGYSPGETEEFRAIRP